MSLSIANNISSLNAQHNLGRASSALNKSIERLSSGLKVNRGADGPAALVISEKQRAQIAGLRQALDNTEKAVSVVQTAEGALNEINSLLVKVRSLAVDSANAGVNDDAALAASQSEIKNALDTIDRIATNTQFGSKKLLDGSSRISTTATDSDVTVLSTTNDTKVGSYDVAVTTVGERALAQNGTAQTGNLAAAEVLTVNDVTISLASGLDQQGVIDRINEFTDQTGVVAEDNSGNTRLYTSDFGSAASISVVSDTAAAATSSGFGTTAISDTGVDVVGTINGVAGTGSGNELTSGAGDSAGIKISVAVDSSDATRTVTGAQGSITVADASLVFQIGANKGQTASIGVDSVKALNLGTGVTGNQFSDLSAIDVTAASGAADAIEIIDKAIDNVTDLRGTLGAFQQHTLEATANNLRTTLENTINAESVIRDTDFAEEIAEFTKNQVLVQAGTSVLSNANQAPSLILSLLQ